MKPLLLTLLLFAYPAHAEWVIYSEDLNQTEYYYEPQWITHHDNHGKAMMVWSRSNRTNGLETRIKYELHCPSLSYRIHYQLVQGKETTYLNARPEQHWEYAIPDSPQMALTQLICTEYE